MPVEARAVKDGQNKLRGDDTSNVAQMNAKKPCGQERERRKKRERGGVSNDGEGYSLDEKSRKKPSEMATYPGSRGNRSNRRGPGAGHTIVSVICGEAT